jgi:hypothetical protein
MAREMNPRRARRHLPLLASGKNVVSTAVTALIYPKAMGQPVVDRLEAACAEGRTFHATGIEPGYRRGAPAHHVRDLPENRLTGRQEVMDY